MSARCGTAAVVAALKRIAEREAEIEALRQEAEERVQRARGRVDPAEKLEER